MSNGSPTGSGPEPRLGLCLDFPALMFASSLLGSAGSSAALQSRPSASCADIMHWVSRQGVTCADLTLPHAECDPLAAAPLSARASLTVSVPHAVAGTAWHTEAALLPATLQLAPALSAVAAPPAVPAVAAKAMLLSKPEPPSVTDSHHSSAVLQPMSASCAVKPAPRAVMPVDLATSCSDPSLCKVGSVPTSIKLGSDCCGLCTELLALLSLGFSVDFAFASDLEPSVQRYVHEHYSPTVWHDNLLLRNNNSPDTPAVDLYCAGFPCQPFSAAGGRAGLLDPRGTVFFGCLDYISAKRPAVFLLENVKGLLSHDRGNTFKTIMDSLKCVGGGCYSVCHEILNAEDSGVPQHRERLFIVGRLKSACVASFNFPPTLPHASIEIFLDLPSTRASAHPPLSAQAQLNLDDELVSLCARGLDPSSECFVIDIDASKRFRSVMRGRSPCLLKSRTQGFYLTNRGRRMTIDEMSRLQGFQPVRSKTVSRAGLAAMVGNAMNLTVTTRILACVLPTVGFHVETCVRLSEAASLPSVRASPFADGLLTDSPVTAMMRVWSTTILQSSTSFGLFAREFTAGSVATLTSRCRDVLPLPVLTHACVGFHPFSIADEIAIRLLNITCAGLNWLFFGCGSAPIPRSSTNLHRSVFRRLVCKLECALSELRDTARAPMIAGSFRKLTSTTADKFPCLRADDVDVLDSAGQLDPMSFMPAQVSSVLQSPDLLFPKGVDHIPSYLASREPHHGDRVTLTIRMLRAGKLALMKNARASADTFVVGKRDSAKLRDIWNGGRITDAAIHSLKPPLQANPAALANLEASDDRPQTLTCRDGKIFFDQLRIPSSLQPFFGRPRIAIEHLRSPPPCESGAVAAEGLSEAELDLMVADGCLDDTDVHVTPVSATWPMGFGWSSYVAQSTMVAACLRAGFREEEIMSSERLLLPESEVSVAIATDDVNLFKRLSPAELASSSGSPLGCLDAEWVRMGLQGHPGKALDLVRDGRVLGVNLREGVRLQCGGDKLWTLLESTLDLTCIHAASPAALAVLNGHLQWQNLMNRPLYACLHHVYDFIHILPDSVERAVPDSVLSELLLNMSLFPFWSADLRRPWWPLLPATDASPAYGFGLSVADCEPSLTRAVAAAASDNSCYIRLTRAPGDPEELPRLGQAFRIPMEFDDFRTVFSVRAEETSHSGAMELQAVKMALLRLTRSGSLHSHRGVVLVDAQAVGFALQKGRSSAGTLRRGVGAVAAISLAADLKLSYPYLPSESNPADFPSRGKVKKSSLKPRHRPPKCSSIELLDRAYRRALRRLRDDGALDF
jgi:site-specific DNA-cytosine methylase